MRFLPALIEAVKRHYRRKVTYGELVGLEDWQLADIGISRTTIAHVNVLGHDGLAQVQSDVEDLSNANEPLEPAGRNTTWRDAG